MDDLALFGASFRDRDISQNFLAVGCPVDDYVTRRLCLQQNETKHLMGEAEQSVTRGTKLTF